MIALNAAGERILANDFHAFPPVDPADGFDVWAAIREMDRIKSDPACIAERVANRATCNAAFDAIRDRDLVRLGYRDARDGGAL